MSQDITTAVFPIAGLGTRLLPATKTVSKELMPVYDRPLIQLAVEEARAAGVRRFVFVTSPDNDAVAEFFAADTDLADTLASRGKERLARTIDDMTPSGSDEFIFVTQEEPLGLGHAIRCAEDAVSDGPFAVVLPDDVIIGDTPALCDMVYAYDPGLADHMVASMVVPLADVSKYGILRSEEPLPGRYVSVHEMVEKPRMEEAPSRMGIVGRYILGASIFDALHEIEPGSGGELQLTDAIARQIDGKGVCAYHISGARYDCGNPDGLLDASNALRGARSNPAIAAA